MHSFYDQTKYLFILSIKQAFIHVHKKLNHYKEHCHKKAFIYVVEKLGPE